MTRVCRDIMAIQEMVTANLASATCTAARARSVTQGRGSVSAKRNMLAELVDSAKVRY